MNRIGQLLVQTFALKLPHSVASTNMDDINIVR